MVSRLLCHSLLQEGSGGQTSFVHLHGVPARAKEGCVAALRGTDLSRLMPQKFNVPCHTFRLTLRS